MSNIILTLGGVPFQDFEVPEQIRFGGAQRLAVHELIGGGRVVDAPGDDAGEISFSGIFSGLMHPPGRRRWMRPAPWVRQFRSCGMGFTIRW
jgi:hypothetical protein